jgi:hypothetical protein
LPVEASEPWLKFVFTPASTTPVPMPVEGELPTPALDGDERWRMLLKLSAYFASPLL